MEKYQRSLKHKENARKAFEIARQKLQLKKQKRIEEYEKNSNQCKNCNKVFDYKHRHNIFCSQSCANSFNNKKRILSDETKTKISSKLKGIPTHKLNGYFKNEKGTYEKISYIKICKFCNKEFKTYKKTQQYCSQDCARRNNGKNEITRKKISDKVQERIKNGTFSGWKSRKDNSPSYAEQYFINLFDNEKIIGWKRDLKVGRWFIDFAFEDKKFALEIDGKQHLERKEHDKIKDDYLIKNGWKVLRIIWYNPINENNKEKLYRQIKELKTILDDKFRHIV